jgi:hypothetical protein
MGRCWRCRIDPDELWAEAGGVREAVRPVLADVGETAQFLRCEAPCLTNDATKLFLDNLIRT